MHLFRYTKTLVKLCGLLAVALAFALVRPRTDDARRNLAARRTTANTSEYVTEARTTPSSEPSTNISYNHTAAKYFHQPRISLNAQCAHCKARNETSWRLTVFVKSTAGNFRRRSLIRRTWGYWNYVENAFVRVVFVVGKPEAENTKLLLREESLRNGDLLNYDGPDDYRRIATKTLTSMQWAADNLPRDHLFASADDDFLVNLGVMQETVAASWASHAGVAAELFPIVCMYRLIDKARPYRNNDSKWFLTREEYAPDTFPRSCLGGMYVTSVGMASRLLKAARSHEAMRVDDVWITGILRKELGISEELVVQGARYAAKHQNGFARGNGANQRDFMRAEWARTYDQFKHKTLCACGA